MLPRNNVSGKVWKKEVQVRNGLKQEDAKKIVKQIKDSGLKVQASINDDLVRVTAKKIDDLQEVIQASKSWGLGIPHWRTTLSITLRSATAGVITGVMLAFARVAGETAPLLFTAFGNQFWNLRVDQPTAALPLQIFVYAISPFDDWHRQAWAGALVLIILIILTAAAVRLFAGRGVLKGSS